MIKEGGPMPADQEKEASLAEHPAVRKVLELEPHFDDYEFGAEARSDRTGLEVSEDAFLRNISSLANREGGLTQYQVRGAILAMDNILKRKSMQESRHRETFEEALQAAAERFSFDLGDKKEKEEE